MCDQKIHYTVYKIINKLDGKYYVGVHSTFNPMDPYFGSGVEILEALKLEGRENFYKEILFDFDTEKEMLDKEAEIVDRDFVLRGDTYNRSLGGGPINCIGRITVKNITTGKTLSVCTNDPKIKTGELVCCTTGKVVVKDKEGKRFQVSKDDPRLLSGELVGICKGTVVVKDKEGNKFRIDLTDPRLGKDLIPLAKGIKLSKERKEQISKQFKGIPKTKEHNEKNSDSNKGKIFTDKHRKNLSISKTGHKDSDETKNKKSKSHIGLKQSLDTIEKRKKSMQKYWRRNQSSS